MTDVKTNLNVLMRNILDFEGTENVSRVSLVQRRGGPDVRQQSRNFLAPKTRPSPISMLTQNKATINPGQDEGPKGQPLRTSEEH